MKPFSLPLPAIAMLAAAAPAAAAPGLGVCECSLRIGNTAASLWEYRAAGDGGARLAIRPPTFEIDGRPVLALFDHVAALPQVRLSNGGVEQRFEGRLKGYPALTLRLREGSRVSREH